jgi:hypothetical protein
VDLVLSLKFPYVIEQTMGQPANGSYRLTQAGEEEILFEVNRGKDHGSLKLRFMAHQHWVEQTFAIARAGERTWRIQCPETHKMVNDLYRLWGEDRFRSRFALRLTYRSTQRNDWERHEARILKLMKRLGVKNPTYPLSSDDLPPIEADMSWETFELRDQIFKEIVRMHRPIW